MNLYEEWKTKRDKIVREMLRLGYPTKEIQKRLGIDINLINKIRGGIKKKM